MYRFYGGKVDSSICTLPLGQGGAFSFFDRFHCIVGVRKFEFQAVIEELLDVEHILLVVVAGQLIVGMLGEIILVGEESF